MKIINLKILLVFVPMVSSFAVFTQNNTIDSLKKVLQTQTQDTNKVNTLNLLSEKLDHERDTALLYAKQALDLSRKIKFIAGEGDAFYRYAIALKGLNYFGERGTLNEILPYLQNATNIFRSIGDQTKIADCYYQVAVTYFDLDRNYPEAIKNGLSALKLYERINDKKKLAPCYLQLAKYYSEVEDNSTQELNFARAGLRTYEDLKDSVKVAYALNHVGQYHFNNNDYDSASQYFNKGLALYVRLGKRGPDFGIPWTKGWIGDIYMEEGNKYIKAGNTNPAYKKIHTALRIFKERLQIETAGKCLTGNPIVNLVIVIFY